MIRKPKVLLSLILLVAAFLRFYQIDTNPKALYGDSLTLVYDAYSIYQTGRDQKGQFLPLVFSLGGGRPAGYVYATVPFAVLFGPTALAARMTSVLSGIGIVLLLYFLGKKFFSADVGLAIAAVAALNPWELSLSREAFETHFALFLALLGFYAFLRGFKKGYWFIIAGIAFGLTSQTYSTYKLTTPLLIGLLFLWKKKDIFSVIRKPIFVLFLFIIVLSSTLSVYLTVSRGSEDRFDIINIFKDPALRSSISQKVRSDRLLDSLPSFISDKLHSPQSELAGVVVENYIKNFLPEFLFIKGDGAPRHNPAGMGEFFWIDALFLIIGITYLYRFKKGLLVLLTGWILIAPVATSLVGGAHALRSSFLLPPLLILIGIGLWRLWNSRNKLILRGVFILFLFQLVYFIDNFYFVAPQKYARFWSYPAKEATNLAVKNRQKFDFVILSNDIDNMEFAYPVYTKLDPNLVIKQNQSRTKIGEYPFFKYDNVYIGSLPHTRIMQFIKDLPGSVLYIGSDKEQPNLENSNLIRGFDGNVDLVVVVKQGEVDLILP